MRDTSHLLPRRYLLRHSCCVFGLMGLASLLVEQGRSAELKHLAAGLVPLFASRHIARTSGFR